MTTIISKKNDKFYYCNLCDFNTCKLTDYNRHVVTKKHISNETATYSNKKHEKHSYMCENCGKEYNDRTGLWRHKKVCKFHDKIEEKEKDEPSDKELMCMLIKQNSELIKEHSDIKEMILEIVKNGTMNNSHNTTNNTHTNSHNKAFNLTFFLNETCKNAMNITDFVDSIKFFTSY